MLLLAILITVTGSGHATASPDMAVESFTISTNASSAAQATSQNNQRYNALLDALRSAGLRAQDVKTSSLDLSYSPPPERTEIAPQPRGPFGYIVNRSIEVTLHDVNAAGRVFDAAIGAGVTSGSGINFGVADMKALTARALAAAVENARATADAMARASGLRILRVHSMQQGFASVPQAVFRANATADVVATPTQIAPNPVRADANVTMVFEAQ